MKKKSKPRKRLAVINVKLSRETLRELRAKAKKHAKGNLSAFLRQCGLKYIPKKGEKISLEA